MKKSIVKKVSEEIADIVMKSNYLNNDDLTTEISFILKYKLFDLMSEFTAKEEMNYIKLLEIQSNNKVGSKEYVAFGYKLAAAKQRKASSNRLLNNVAKETKYSKLVSFVSSKFGEEELKEFYKTL